MRTFRGLFASLGAATCLVLAGTIVMALLSGYVAFHGWPGVDVPAAREQQQLLALAQAGERPANAPSLRIPATDRTVRVRVRVRAASGAVAHPRREASPGSARRPAGGPHGTTPARPVPAAAPAGVPKPPARPTGPAAGTGEVAAATVNGVGEDVAAAATPVSPAAGHAAATGGGVVAATATAAGQALDDLVPGL